MKRLIFGAALLLVMACGQKKEVITDKTPTGQHANYMVDTNPSRTMSEIKSGKLGIQVGNHTPNFTYDVQVSYTMKIAIVGIKNGSMVIPVEDYYWEPDFWDRLRKTGHYQSARYTIDHLGYTDAQSLDGTIYTGCDRLKITNIDFSDSISTDLSKLTVYAEVKLDKIPALGAAKVDVSGPVNGFQIRAGVDYIVGPVRDGEGIIID